MNEKEKMELGKSYSRKSAKTKTQATSPFAMVGCGTRNNTKRLKKRRVPNKEVSSE